MSDNDTVYNADAAAGVQQDDWTRTIELHAMNCALSHIAPVHHLPAALHTSVMFMHSLARVKASGSLKLIKARKQVRKIWVFGFENF